MFCFGGFFHNFFTNIYSALYSFGLGCVYTWRLIDFPDSRNTSHLSCFLCLSSPTEGSPLWMKFSLNLWPLGSAFVSSPVTTNNFWIAVNVSAAASPPSPLWTIGLHSTCTNRTLSWDLHYQLCCIWYLRFPPYNASINWTTVILFSSLNLQISSTQLYNKTLYNPNIYMILIIYISFWKCKLLVTEFKKIYIWPKECSMSCWKWPI